MTKQRNFLAALVLAFVFAFAVGSAHAVVYYDLDFEDGTTGGGTPFAGGPASNIASANLDGRALLFEVDDQMQWLRNNIESGKHFVSFDFFSLTGANVTFFLDAPSIARFDYLLVGRHHVDMIFDLVNDTITAFVDGVLDPGNPTIDAWPSNPVTVEMRIANQSGAPGNSTNSFEIDNLRWTGVPAPGTAALLLVGIIPLLMRGRITRKK